MTFFGKVNFELDEKKHTIVDGRNPAPYDTIIYRVSYFPGGAGFQPSTVGVSKLLHDDRPRRTFEPRTIPWLVGL